MSERSIAEIIGWEIVENPWHGFRAGEEPTRVRANGEYWSMSKWYHPTVDDMLAWWRPRVKRDAHVSIDWREGQVVVELWDYELALAYRSDYQPADIVTGTAPTLLAALEAAVRAVEETA